MKISMVVAVGANKEIGKGNELLWRLPKDMQRFKDVTMGHHVLMGRKTWESIPLKFRALPGRTNLVLTRNPNYVLECGADNSVARVINSIEDGIQIAEAAGEQELMLIGGAEVYKQGIDKYASRVYLTTVCKIFQEADVFFPGIPENEWFPVGPIETHEADEKNKIRMIFSIFERGED